jgi:hypothetical protein
VKDTWTREIENLSADWQRALHRAATTTDPEIRDIYTDLANCYQAKVQHLRLKMSAAKAPP